MRKRIKIIAVSVVLAIAALNMIPCYYSLTNLKYLKLNSQYACQSNFFKTSLIYPVFLSYEEKIPNFKIETFRESEKHELILGKTIQALYDKSSLLAVIFWHSVVTKPGVSEASMNLKKIICLPNNPIADFNKIEKFNYFPDDSKPATQNICIN